MSHEAKTLREARQRQNMTQYALGGRSAVSPSEISKAENGWLRLRPEQATRIAEALGVDAASVRELAGAMQPQ